MTDFPTITPGESWSTGPGQASALLNRITAAINALEAARVTVTDNGNGSLTITVGAG